MHRLRAVQITVNDTTTRDIVNRGCPPGGVLSPLLWNIVINELITKFNKHLYYTIRYADDITILATGNFASVTFNTIQSALKIVERWCKEHTLTVNPDKTELVLFTKKRKIGDYELPKLFGKN